jgi:hypothetical protein
MGAFSTFSMTLSQDRRLGALIVTHTDLAHHTKTNGDCYSPSTYMQLGSDPNISQTSAKDELLDRNLR